MSQKGREAEAARRAKELLGQMTLSEKVGQVNQRLYGFAIYEREGEEITFDREFKEEVEKYGGLGCLYGLYRADPWSGKNETNGLGDNLAVGAYNQVQAYVLEHSRLKIPTLLSSECPHGHQALGGYLLPVNLGMGATFHPKLVGEAYRVCGRQLKSLGVDLALISLVDVARDPRWGRSEECFSEDPRLCAAMAETVVEAVQSEGVSVVAKHFAGQGETTGGVNASAARIGERELREIHLPAMKACCQAGVDGVMAAYNEIDGVYCHANRRLLTDILRDEMGFDGVVMADGCAIDQLDAMTGDNLRSAALALEAGVDMGLWDEAYGNLEEAIRRGYIEEAKLDRAVLRVLEMKFSRGLFEHPFLEEDAALPSFSYEDYPQSLELARESVVLLENKDGILPLPKEGARIALIGPNGDSLYNQLGDYSPPVKKEEGFTLLEGIRCVLGENQDAVRYAKGCGTLCGTKEEQAEALALAGDSDLVILALGGSSSRFGEVTFDKNGAALSKEGITMDCGEGMDTACVELPKVQQELAQSIFATGKKVITVLIGGRAYAPGALAGDSQALLYAFYPGMQGGRAIAEVLFGEINPSGRLPVSLPRSSGQLPVYYNYKNSYRGMHYCDEEEGAHYPFGFGLSYTDFSWSGISLSKNKISPDDLKREGVLLRMTVTNEGDRDGYAVPLLYIAGQQGSTVRRVKELKDFRKIWVEKGKRAEISMQLTYDSFAIWDTAMEYRAEPGRVRLMLEESGGRIWSGTVELLAT